MSEIVKASQLPLFTLKEVPADAQIKSHQLLLKAGYIRKQAAGLYVFLPLGQMVHRKIEQIIREQMNAFGAVEVKLPIITSRQLWETSGRWSVMGAEMMRMSDRHHNEFALGPTHEESITWLAQNFLQSYKQLPVNLYQIGTKYRDEIRPRYGLIRCREFVMKDAYSFHLDEASLDETYQKMRECYRSIFERCSLQTIAVQADSGAMGGGGSEEFMVASDIGEETLLLCEDNSCGYKSNQEKTAYVEIENKVNNSESSESPQKVLTQDLKSIEEVAAFLKIEKNRLMKTLVLSNNEVIVVAFLPGHKDANLAKIQKNAQSSNLDNASDFEIREIFQAPAGYLGPYQWSCPDSIVVEDENKKNKKKKVIVLCDQTLQNQKDLVCGANQEHFHYQNIDIERDLGSLTSRAFFADIVNAESGDLCPQCQKVKLTQTKGIEVGHIFKLGDKYTKAFNLNVLDIQGKAQPLIMGCYGIGVGRTMATVIEQTGDQQGIVWPRALSPFDVYWVSLAKSDEEKQQEQQVLEKLRKQKICVYCDDRNERPGVKFNDSELVGFPVIIVCGKSFFQEKKLEVKIRHSGEKLSIHTDEVSERIDKLLQNL